MMKVRFSDFITYFISVFSMKTGHRRHHDFKHEQSTYYEEERRKFAFGSSYLSPNVSINDCISFSEKDFM
jgi:hypothetical protein